MIAYGIYQILPNQRDRKIHRIIGWPFAIMNLFFSLWLIAASIDGSAPQPYDVFGALITVVVIILMLFVLIYSFTVTQIKEANVIDTNVDDWLISFPLNTYFAWISIATIANITDFLYDRGFTGNGKGEYWTIFVLFAAFLVISLITYLSSRKIGLFGFIGVIEWALFGLLVRNLELSNITSIAICTLMIYSLIIFILKIIQLKKVHISK